MNILSEQSACLGRRRRGSLLEAFRPVATDLRTVGELLSRTLKTTECSASREMLGFLLESPGKRLRPALVLLSSRAAGRGVSRRLTATDTSVKLSVAVELIHMASLVHDDLIDGAMVRHGRPSINSRWGRDISVALGDLLCAQAFRLIADCDDPRFFAMLGSELTAMCEGELLQVADRMGFLVSEGRCLEVIEKKTASLFSACCHGGALVATDQEHIYTALQRFGFHFGVAFQILDDCRDLLAGREDLGKEPGQDWFAGDITLPLLYGKQYGARQDGGARSDVDEVAGTREFVRIHDAFRASEAPARIMKLVESHIGHGKRHLQVLADSPSKESLQQIADIIAASMADILTR